MITKFKLLAFLLLLFTRYAGAQDVEQVVKSKPIIVHGGIMGTGSLYHVEGDESRRDPFYWQFVANLNFKFWGIIDMPFSAQFAKKNVHYNQPSFKQFGMSPKYKSLTLHLGYRNMTFSNYSLSGLTFLGAGIEYQPEKFWLKASAMYGRFFKARPYSDSTLRNFEDPSYERWGGGAKITAVKNNQEISLIVFKAADKANSIPTPPIGSNLTPGENLVTGFSTRNKIGNNFTLRLEYTVSAYTADTRNITKQFDSYTYLNNLGPIFTPKYSSTIGKALEVQGDFHVDFISMGISYKRIDPNYRSMGSTFIENDVEDILFNASKSLLKNRINLSGSLGRQHNNLDNSKQTEDVRVIGSANGSFAISKALNCNVNYSNFTSSSQPSLINFTDSVRFFQINKNTSFSINYNKGSEEIKHGISCTIALQEGTALNRSATLVVETKNQMQNGSVSYNVSFPKLGLSVVSSLQASNFKTGLNTTSSYGPSFSVVRSLLKNKLNISLSYSYLLSKIPVTGNTTSNIIRLNSDFKIDKFQSFNIYSSFLARNQPNGAQNTPNLRELQAGLTYQFTF